VAKASLLFDALIRRLKPTAILVCQLKFCILFYCSFSLLAKAVLIVNFLDPLVKTDGNKYSPLQLSFLFSFFLIAFGFSQQNSFLLFLLYYRWLQPTDQKSTYDYRL